MIRPHFNDNYHVLFNLLFITYYYYLLLIYFAVYYSGLETGKVTRESDLRFSYTVAAREPNETDIFKIYF